MSHNSNLTFLEIKTKLSKKIIDARKIDSGSSLSSDNDKRAIELLAPEALVLKIEQIKDGNSKINFIRVFLILLNRLHFRRKNNSSLKKFKKWISKFVAVDSKCVLLSPVRGRGH